MNLDEDPEAKFLRERMILGGKFPSESSLDAVGIAAKGLRSMKDSRSAFRSSSRKWTADGRRSRTPGTKSKRGGGGGRKRSQSLPNKSYEMEGPLPVRNDYDSLIGEIEKQKAMIARAVASREARLHAPILKRPSTATLLREIPAKYPTPPPIVK